MNVTTPTRAEPLLKEPFEFSLVLGGPLYQLWRRSHLAGNTLELLGRRVAVLTLRAWAPLLVLSFAEGHFWGGSINATMKPSHKWDQQSSN